MYCGLVPSLPLLIVLPKAIGFVYVSKAKHHLATRQTLFGVGGWLHNVQGKYHVFSETYAHHTNTPIGSNFFPAGYQLYGLRWN